MRLHTKKYITTILLFITTLYSVIGEAKIIHNEKVYIGDTWPWYTDPSNIIQAGASNTGVVLNNPRIKNTSNVIDFELTQPFKLRNIEITSDGIGVFQDSWHSLVNFYAASFTGFSGFNVTSPITSQF